MTPAGVVARIGGLAAALGAGVIVGLAVAAPASADNSGAGDSGRRAAAAEHPAGRPSSGATAAVTKRGRAARTAPAAVVPTPNAVTAQSNRHEPARAPAALSSSLTADSRGKRITVYKGLHVVLPGSPAFFVKQVAGTGTFTADSAYDLKDSDQYDWNKFTGIVFSPLQHDRNSVMVGWRYNLATQQFEIAPFYNVNKERVPPNEKTEVISVPAGATFQYTVDYSGVTIGYGDKTVFKPYPPGLTPNVWTASRVSGWFGGNEAAPRTITYYLNLT